VRRRATTAAVALALLTLAACAVDEAPAAVNHAPIVDYEALQPAMGSPLVMDCSEDDGSQLTFALSNALDDPDGDALHVLWYVNYSPENPTAPDSDDPQSLTVTCFDSLVAGTNVVEALVMDRPSEGNTAAALRRVEAGGYALHLVWPVTFTPTKGSPP
jgi:hypothetical protein